MSAVERNILTVVEPTIVLDELEMTDVESGTENSDDGTMKEKPSKFSTMIPLIRINNYEVQGDRLEMFELECTGFYPTCRFSFFDRDGMFTARFFPKDGDLIQLYIRSQGDETTFKPIRIDFTVENIKPLGGGGATDTSSQLMVEGRMNVPNLFTEKVQFQDNTSWNSLQAIAEGLKLGYASNVEDTADQQVWTNPYDTSEKFIQDITSNSYLNDESFFTAYIDPYYYLTFVDANKFFGQEDDLEVSQMFQQNAMDTMGSGDQAETNNEFPNVLSNQLDFQGTARYISKYQQVNNSGKISKNNGYKRYTQYWDLNAKEFVSEFVDPLTTDTEGMVPVTKGRVTPEGEVEGPREEQVKFKFLGTQGDNVHENYYYASIQNFQNLAEINKLGMTIELDTVNPAILRYSRIYCHMMETAQMVKGVLTATENDENAPTDTQRRKETTDNAGSDTSNEFGVINEYLSGFYVITGMEYFMTKGPQPGGSGLRQRLHLRRREVTPTT
jgi:hypothetical protein